MQWVTTRPLCVPYICLGQFFIRLFARGSIVSSFFPTNNRAAGISSQIVNFIGGPGVGSRHRADECFSFISFV